MSGRRFVQGLQIGFGTALVLLIIWAGGFFSTTRLRFTNLYFLPRETSDTVVIVALDNASLAAYGRAPVEWSRERFADFVTIAHTGGARVIAFDVLFAESTAGDEALATAIQAARQGENVRTRTIMPAAGVDQLESGDGTVLYQQRLTPQATFGAVIDNVGYVNALLDPDGTIRRQMSFVQVGDEPGVSFSLAVLMAYSSIPSAAIPQLVIAEDGQVKITPDLTPDRVLAVDERGLWLQNYFGTPGDTFPTYSLKAVLDGDVDPAVFKDKIVLVGLTNSTGLSDRAPVPLTLNGEMMAGVEVQANAVESLLQEASLREQSRPTQALVILALALIASLLYASLRWYWLLPLAGLLLVGWLVFAFVVFDTQQIVTNLFDTSLAIILPAFVTLLNNVRVETLRRQQTEFLLTSVVAASEQQLAMDKVLPRIAEDVQHIVKAKGGAIWLREGDRLQQAYQWGSYPTHRQNPFQVAQTQPEILGGNILVPIRWQQNLLGGILVMPDQKVDRDTLHLFSKLTTRLAPGLAGTLLYAESQQQKALLEHILNGSPGGILLLADNLDVRQSNPEANSILGYAEGKPLINALQAAEVPANIQAKLMATFAQKQAFREDIKIGQRVFTLAGVPLTEVGGWVVILNDISILSELSDLKTQMIRIASHDLKNPLSRVMGYGEILLDSELDESSKRFINNIMKAAHEMNTLITEILNLEQLRSGHVESAPFDLAVMVREVVDRHIQDMQLKKQTYQFQIPDTLPNFNGDQRQLAQAFTNLVGNAVKYTPDGGAVTIRLYPQDKTVRFEVQDTGYGISEEAQAKLFTQFYRVRTAANAHIQGTGLGLSLVKSTIEAHHGRIWVESQEGVGSTFFVDLPYTPDNRAN